MPIYKLTETIIYTDMIEAENEQAAWDQFHDWDALGTVDKGEAHIATEEEIAEWERDPLATPIKRDIPRPKSESIW